MNIIFLIKSAFAQLYRRKRGFAITCVVLTISYVILEYGLLIMMAHLLGGTMAKQVFGVDSERIVAVDLYNYNTATLEKRKEIYDFIINLHEIEGVCGAGIFAYEGGQGEYLIISRQLLPITKLKDKDGKSLQLGRTEQQINVCVGADLENQYPIGARVPWWMKNQELVVNQILQKNTFWVYDTSTLLGNINLDRVCIMSMESVAQREDYMLPIGNIYYWVDDESDIEDIKGKIAEQGNKHGITIYKQQTVKELVYRDWQLAMEHKEELIVPILLFVVAIIAMVYASILEVYTRRKDIGILYSIGYTRGEIFVIYLLENTFKAIIPFLICITFWEINYRQLYMMEMRQVYCITQMITLIFAIVVLVVSSVIPFIRLNQLDLATIMGGEQQ